MVAGSDLGGGCTGRLARLAAVVASLMLGACAQLGGLDREAPEAALTKGDDAPKASQSDLQKAVEYWGKQHEKNPTDLKTALNYTRNLKAAGEKERALAVLQNASVFHAQDRELQSEYGRLALELDQLSLALKLLEAADDPGKPDWRIVNARGAALAKQGQYAQAVPLFERAAAMAPSQPSVVNNLAMAYAADGQPDRAEQLLRKTIEQGGGDAKLRQNLVLVLGLQGKYDEARQLGAREANPAVVAHDVDYLRKMVRYQPPAAPAAGVAPGAVQQAKAEPAPLRGTTGAQASAGGTQGWSTQVVARADAEISLKATKR